MKKELTNISKSLTGFLVSLSTCKGMEIFDASEIVRIEAISNYSKLFFSNGKTLVVAKVLRQFHDKLPQGSFVRVHRSHIVNVKYIKYYTGSKKSSLVLTDESIIEISRRKKSDVSKMLQFTFAA